MPVVEVVRTYLELTHPGALRGVPFKDPHARVRRLPSHAVVAYRELYREVGERWHWHERLEWSDEQLAAYLSSADVTVSELLVGEESAGYFELRRHPEDVEIAYFGLVPRFIGRGLGGALLTRAARDAWALGAGRVWLHTCTLDSPHALPNYLARGFREFKSERFTIDIAQSA
jgi:GNAT superfamily N-acetyltransferase